jgi:hypothetical protein
VGHVLETTSARPSRLRLSPDGRYLAIAYHPTLEDDRGLVVILDREGRRVASTREWASLDGLAWAKGGREVWFTASEVGADNSLRALDTDGRVRSVLAGTGRLVLHDVASDRRMLLERTTLLRDPRQPGRRAGAPRPLVAGLLGGRGHIARRRDGPLLRKRPGQCRCPRVASSITTRSFRTAPAWIARLAAEAEGVPRRVRVAVHRLRRRLSALMRDEDAGHGAGPLPANSLDSARSGVDHRCPTGRTDTILHQGCHRSASRRSHDDP